jgi:hypothetical protein
MISFFHTNNSADLNKSTSDFSIGGTLHLGDFILKPHGMMTSSNNNNNNNNNADNTSNNSTSNNNTSAISNTSSSSRKRGSGGNDGIAQSNTSTDIHNNNSNSGMQQPSSSNVSPLQQQRELQHRPSSSTMNDISIASPTTTVRTRSRGSSSRHSLQNNITGKSCVDYVFCLSSTIITFNYYRDTSCTHGSISLLALRVFYLDAAIHSYMLLTQSRCW